MGNQNLFDEILEMSSGHSYGDYFTMHCPFHGSDNHPSMLINERGYNCLSCHAHGTLENLIRKLQGKPLKPQSGYSGLPWRIWLQDYTITMATFCLHCHYSLTKFPQNSYYLRNRGIDSAINPLLLGYIDGYYTFPIKDEANQIVGVVLRAGETIQEEKSVRYFTPPNQEGMLYVPSWRRVAKADIIYIVYGIFDAIALWKCGFPVVTWSIGKNLPAEALDQFRKEIVIIPDLGEFQDGMKLACNLGWRGQCKEVHYPYGSKDPSDILSKWGETTLFKFVRAHAS